ncbi:hypothetical protein XENOCAPTIV_016659, partial [Xenoophorus captivus]
GGAGLSRPTRALRGGARSNPGCPPSSRHSVAPLHKLCGSGGPKLTPYRTSCLLGCGAGGPMALLRPPKASGPWLDCRQHSSALSASGPNSWPGTTGSLRKLCLQSSEIGACANQTWRWVTTRVDKRRQSSLCQQEYREGIANVCHTSSKSPLPAEMGTPAEASSSVGCGIPPVAHPPASRNTVEASLRVAARPRRGDSLPDVACSL